MKVLSSRAVADKIGSNANLSSQFQVNITISDQALDHQTANEIIQSEKQPKRNLKRVQKAYIKKQQEVKQYGAQRVLKQFEKIPSQLVSTFKSIQLIESYQSNLLSPINTKITCIHQPILLTGRYLKFSRYLAQTPWFIDGQRKGQGSVAEQIVKALEPIAKCQETTFHAGGREDIDVRMLGNGRPFVAEFKNPKSTLSFRERIDQMKGLINNNSNLVQVTGPLKLATKSIFDELKESQDKKVKRYCCIVWVSKAMRDQDYQTIEKLHNIELDQKTPIRVLHRRSLMTRKKIIHQMRTVPLTNNFFELHLLSSAGTYIKQFIHGDLGRTTPNLCKILERKCDILQLDVTGVFSSLDQANEQIIYEKQK